MRRLNPDTDWNELVRRIAAIDRVYGVDSLWPWMLEDMNRCRHPHAKIAMRMGSNRGTWAVGRESLVFVTQTDTIHAAIVDEMSKERADTEWAAIRADMRSLAIDRVFAYVCERSLQRVVRRRGFQFNENGVAVLEV